jgi:hypothetical protein
VIDGDQILALIADQMHSDGRLSKPGTGATAMSNGGLETHLAERNLELARTAVGARYVIERMCSDGYGGKASGRIILSDSVTTGDGLVATSQGLAAIRQAGRAAREVCRRFEPVPTNSREGENGEKAERGVASEGPERNAGAQARAEGPFARGGLWDREPDQDHGRGRGFGCRAKGGGRDRGEPATRLPSGGRVNAAPWRRSATTLSSKVSSRPV